MGKMTNRYVVILVAALFPLNLLRAHLSESKLIASDGGESQYFGWTTAINGDYIIIGASEDDDKGPSSGSVYIFKHVGTSWIQSQKILASDGFSYDTFGCAVAISDSYAVVGAQLDDDVALNAGSVYILKLENENWVETTKLTASDGAEEDHFGSSVGIYGDYVVIGASLDDDRGENSGSAYVFHREGDAWIQQAKLLASDGEIDDRFEEVAISCDNLIVGAWGDKDQGDLTGSAYIFRREGNTWVEDSKLVASDAAGGDQFGIDVSIFEGSVIVGAYAHDGAGENSGAAYIFHKEATGWVETTKLTASDAAAYDDFGISVSIVGNYAMVGADVTDGQGENSGTAYLYGRDNSTWTEVMKLNAGDAEPYDYFGISVAMSANTLLVGAGGDDDKGFDAGAAYVFDDFEATSVDDGEALPSSFSLEQNYPNPFNPTTTISFSLTAVSQTSLIIYDLLGREVATLVDERKGPGTYTATWNAIGQPSGVYYYRLISGDLVQTRKLVVLK